MAIKQVLLGIACLSLSCTQRDKGDRSPSAYDFGKQRFSGIPYVSETSQIFSIKSQYRASELQVSQATESLKVEVREELHFPREADRILPIDEPEGFLGFALSMYSTTEASAWFASKDGKTFIVKTLSSGYYDAQVFPNERAIVLFRSTSVPAHCDEIRLLRLEPEGSSYAWSDELEIRFDFASIRQKSTPVSRHRVPKTDCYVWLPATDSQTFLGSKVTTSIQSALR